nr:hypothetical protein [Paenibacillus qinlingensis]
MVVGLFIRVRIYTHWQNIRLEQYLLGIRVIIGVGASVNRRDLYIGDIAVVGTGCCYRAQIGTNPFIDGDDIANLNYGTVGIRESSAARIRRGETLFAVAHRRRDHRNRGRIHILAVQHHIRDIREGQIDHVRIERDIHDFLFGDAKNIDSRRRVLTSEDQVVVRQRNLIGIAFRELAAFGCGCYREETVRFGDGNARGIKIRGSVERHTRLYLRCRQVTGCIVYGDGEVRRDIQYRVAGRALYGITHVIHILRIQLGIGGNGTAIREDERISAVPKPSLKNIPFFCRGRQITQRFPLPYRLGSYLRASVAIERKRIGRGIRVNAAPIVAAVATAIIAAVAAGSGVATIISAAVFARSRRRQIRVVRLAAILTGCRRWCRRHGRLILIFPHLHNRVAAHEENSRFCTRRLGMRVEIAICTPSKQACLPQLNDRVSRPRRNNGEIGRLCGYAIASLIGNLIAFKIPQSHRRYLLSGYGGIRRKVPVVRADGNPLRSRPLHIWRIPDTHLHIGKGRGYIFTYIHARHSSKRRHIHGTRHRSLGRESAAARSAE